MSSEVQRTKGSFGFINGLTTTTSFLFPTIALGIVLKINAEIPLFLFIAFAVVTRFLGDWLFWAKMFPQEIGCEEQIFQRKSSFLSNSETIKPMFDMLMDVIADIAIIYLAIKASASPAWIFFVFLGSQAVSSIVQGIVVDRWETKAYRRVSMVIIVLAVISSLEVCNISSPDFYRRLFGLNNFSTPIQMLIILCVKNLLSGIPVISKAAMAEYIQAKIEKMERS